MRNIELKLLSELMKNCRRSDRELAGVLGVSQPTISRMIKKLEEEGYIKEYAMIPDFNKLGYGVMGITSMEVRYPPFKDGFEEMRKVNVEAEKSHPYASLMAVNTSGQSKNRLFISFYEDYSAYAEAMRTVKKIPSVNVDNMESFLVDLADETNYRLLSMSAIAQHLLKRSQKKA